MMTSKKPPRKRKTPDEKAAEKKRAATIEKMEALAHSFPCLRNIPGTLPWDAHILGCYSASPAASCLQQQAIAFLLTLWTGHSTNYLKGGIFDLFLASANWTEEDRAAFVQWFLNPWWPEC